MGNRIIRIILGIVIGIAALVGIYLVLPGNLKNPLIEFFQKTFQSKTYEVTQYYKDQKVPNLDMTFGDMVENAGDGSAWVTDVLSESEDGSTGQYEVHAYVYKVDIAMEQENGQENLMNYTQATVELRFGVKKQADGSYFTSTFAIFVDESPMNDFYKEQALLSLKNKAGNAIKRDEKEKAKEGTTAAQ